MPPSHHKAPTLPAPLLGAGAVALVVVFGAALAEELQHWFLLPLALCGLLVADQAVKWLRGQIDLLDPAGLLAMLGLHFFLFAPLLHVYWQRFMPWVEPPADWRDWLGAMAALNALGLALYRLTQWPLKKREKIGPRLKESQSRTDSSSSQKLNSPIPIPDADRLSIPRLPTASPIPHIAPASPKVLWQLDSTRFALVLSLATLFTLALQTWLLARFGGLSGIIHAYSDPEARSAAFVGLGWVLMFSESFPVLLLFGFVVLARRHPELRGWLVLAAFLLFFLTIQLLFGGLRGSRSNTVWALFWAGGLIHLLVRPIPRRLAGLGLLALMGFMYSYGFYKSFGSEALVALEGSEERAELVERSGRGLDSVLLGDLGRADIQAFILFRQGRPDIGWQPALGRTYLGALALFIPRQIWPERPPTKVKEGTEIQYGPGLAYFSNYQSSRVYGLAGEAMLNFGTWGVPFAFVVLGLLLRWVRGRLVSWSQSGDSRILMAPLLVNLCFVTLGSDLDNLLFFLVKNGFFPFLVVVLSSRRLKIRTAVPISSLSASPELRPEPIPTTSTTSTPFPPAFEPARGAPWS